MLSDLINLMVPLYSRQSSWALLAAGSDAAILFSTHKWGLLCRSELTSVHPLSWREVLGICCQVVEAAGYRAGKRP